MTKTEFTICHRDPVKMAQVLVEGMDREEFEISRIICRARVAEFNWGPPHRRHAFKSSGTLRHPTQAGQRKSDAMNLAGSGLTVSHMTASEHETMER